MTLVVGSHGYSWRNAQGRNVGGFNGKDGVVMGLNEVTILISGDVRSVTPREFKGKGKDKEEVIHKIVDVDVLLPVDSIIRPPMVTVQIWNNAHPTPKVGDKFSQAVRCSPYSRGLSFMW